MLLSPGFQKRVEAGLAALRVMFAGICAVGIFPRRLGHIFCGAVIAAVALPALSFAQNENLRLNEIQYIGTHNSYHQQPDQRFLAYMLASKYNDGTIWPADRLVPALSYTHERLARQLERGIRNLEIDVYYDHDGGHFLHPGAIETLAKSQVVRLDAPPATVLKVPGFKVMHMADLDFRSNCWSLLSCFSEMKYWSDVHPDHVPIILMIEVKEGAAAPLSPDYKPANVLKFDTKAWAALEAEILSVFPRDRLVTPDLVRADAPTLRQAITRSGWPQLDAMRGRVLLTLNAKPAAQENYLKLHTGGHGGLFFCDHGLADPETIWVFRKNPYATDLPSLVRSGYLVYTRADADGLEARQNNTARRDRAFTAAQVISTDYPAPDPAVGIYRAVFPDGGYVRANPLLRPALQAELGKSD